METEVLIRALAERVEPVRPLRTAWLRTTGWAVAGGLYLSMLTWIMSPRSDLATRLYDAPFLVEQGAALVTGLTAALAAFATVVPGHSRRILWLPVASAVSWLAVVSGGGGASLLRAGPRAGFL